MPASARDPDLNLPTILVLSQYECAPRRELCRGKNRWESQRSRGGNLLADLMADWLNENWIDPGWPYPYESGSEASESSESFSNLGCDSSTSAEGCGEIRDRRGTAEARKLRRISGMFGL